MRVLVACEFSGRVREAFRKRGHDAWSCDLLPSEDGSPYHVQGDCSQLLAERFDLLIAHPPCTYLTCAGNKWFKPEYLHRFPDRRERLRDAIDFFMLFTRTCAKRVCIENPIGRMNTLYRKPDQIVQPYQFGHPDRKPTCLWLFGLQPLKETNVVAPNIKQNRNGKTASVHHDAALSLPAEERWKVRSRTYQGIANAMAEQWGVQ
jgi:hypothetical protein